MGVYFRNRSVTLFLLYGLGISTPSQSLAADSLQASIDDIAIQIIDRIDDEKTQRIGISTFTHSDRSCSEVSNFISEFIVDSLFSNGSDHIQLIERSQLSAIFKEMKMIFDGTIAPDTAKRLGEIAGVDALVTGAITEFGDKVMLQARLISTADGTVFATARSDFPRIDTVQTMMAGRSLENCGYGSVSTANFTTPDAVSEARAPTKVNNINNDMWSGQPQQNLGPLRAIITSAGMNGMEGGSVQLTIGVIIENISDRDIRLLLIGSPPLAIDNNGNTYTMTSFSGVTPCRFLDRSASQCMRLSNTNSTPSNVYTQAPVGGQLVLTYGFSSSQKIDPGGIITFSSNFALLEIIGDGSENQEINQYSINVGIPNIPIDTRD